MIKRHMDIYAGFRVSLHCLKAQTMGTDQPNTVVNGSQTTLQN